VLPYPNEQATVPEPSCSHLRFRFVDASDEALVLPLLMALANDNQAQAPQPALTTTISACWWRMPPHMRPLACAGFGV
jgi:hypothetical protein